MACLWSFRDKHANFVKSQNKRLQEIEICQISQNSQNINICPICPKKIVVLTMLLTQILVKALCKTSRANCHWPPLSQALIIELQQIGLCSLWSCISCSFFQRKMAWLGSLLVLLKELQRNLPAVNSFTRTSLKQARRHELAGSTNKQLQVGGTLRVKGLVTPKTTETLLIFFSWKANAAQKQTTMPHNETH